MKERTFLSQQRKVYEYQNLNSYDYDYDENKKRSNFENNKNINNNKILSTKAAQKINNIFDKYFIFLKEFYSEIFNRYDENIRNVFYIMLFAFLIEKLLINLSVKYILIIRLGYLLG